MTLTIKGKNTKMNEGDSDHYIISIGEGGLPFKCVVVFPFLMVPFLHIFIIFLSIISVQNVPLVWEEDHVIYIYQSVTIHYIRWMKCGNVWLNVS